MTRTRPLTAAVTLLAAATPALLAARAAFGQAPPAAPPSAAAPAPLPIRDVVLFTSGVSYLQREGEVNGDATVPLTFRTAQINDILKSLILLDERGRVQPAVYGARDPIGRTLQSFAVDLSQPLSRADLLNRLRGARVESPDIRAGMAMLIAALCAEGASEIGNIRQIDRGYERIDERLRGLGARIERVATEPVHA